MARRCTWEMKGISSTQWSSYRTHICNAVAKPMLNLPLPFKASRQFAAGHLLCPDHRDGKITFEQYLELKYA